MKFRLQRKSDELGAIPRIFMMGLVVLVLGIVGFTGWKVAGNGLNAKAAGYFEVENEDDVYVGACKVDISESSHQISLKVINDAAATATVEARTYGSGVLIRSFKVPASSTSYPARYITPQSTIVISTNGSSISVPVASLPGC